MNLRRSVFLLLFVSISAISSAQVGFGESRKINNDWRFMLEDVTEAKNKDYDDKRWQNINLPHDWSVKQQLSPTLASCAGYLPGGIAWYRKTIDIPTYESSKNTYIYFEGVYNRSEVYINGTLLGSRPNGYVSFMYDITPYLDEAGQNVISVRVDHSRSADSRWYTGSGIYRDVYLVQANPIHIEQWGVYAYPTIDNNNRGTLNIEVDISNKTDVAEHLQVINELFDRDGKSVAKKKTTIKVSSMQNGVASSTISLSKPQLWSVATPYLYSLKTTVLKNNSIVDESVTKTGFRKFTFDPNKGFALNDEWMKMKGVCIHHDAGVLGSSVPREVWKRRLINLKEIGVNAIRTSHNPQAPDLYDLCDELGLLVMNEAYDEWEFPKRKWLEGWNVGTPGFEGSYDFFEDWGEKDMADIVRRDRNHLSIFAWSIGNEVDYPNDPYSHPVLDGGADTGFTQPIFGGFKKDAPDAMRLGDIAKRLVAVVKKYDKSRATTAGLAGVAMSNETEYPASLDIAGYNYTESMYDSDHAKYPNRVIYGSENRHELAAWKDVRDKDFIFGQFLWTGIDYLGESGRWPSRGFYSGLLDFGGFIKPRGYFRQSLWSDVPMAYLGTYPTPGRGSVNQMKDVWSQLESSNSGSYIEKIPSVDAWSIWNYKEGQMIRVVAYTNAAKARLLLNDEEVGEVQNYNSETGIIFWDIPFSRGTLKVIGMDEMNNEVSNYVISTSGKPHSIKIISEPQVIYEDGVAQVIIQVEDENGVPVMLSDEEITCDVASNGVLLGLEASNNSDMSDYTDNKHRVFHGRMIAYVKSSQDNNDNIPIRFSSPWLESAETLIAVAKK